MALAVNFRKPDDISQTDQDDFIKLVRLISNGHPVPARYYRSGIGKTPDEMLASEGILHLHLGNRASNVIVYLVQYEDRIVVLEISTHDHLDARPPGAVLKSLHASELQRQKTRQLARLETLAKQQANALESRARSLIEAKSALLGPRSPKKK